MSGYFNKFPIIEYGSGANKKAARNILTRTRAREETKNGLSALQVISLTQGDRADYISELLFNRPDFDYVLYLLNDIIDPYYEWYLTPEQLDEYINTKYVNSAENAHHYELISNNQININLDTYSLLSAGERSLYRMISNRTHETAENNKRRFLNGVPPTTGYKIDRDIFNLLNRG